MSSRVLGGIFGNFGERIKRLQNNDWWLLFLLYFILYLVSLIIFFNKKH